MSAEFRAHLESIGESPPTAEVPEGLAWVWRAWQRMHLDRPWRGGGMGPAMPGNIAWRDVLAWCDFHGYTGEAVMVMDACFRGMDAEFTDWYRAQLPPASS